MWLNVANCEQMATIRNMPHYEKTDNGQWTNITQAQAVARERARDDDAWDAGRITRWMRRIGPLRVAWLVRTCGYVSERSRHVVVRSHTDDHRNKD